MTTTTWGCPSSRLILRADAPEQEWLEHRQAGIGGSDSAALIGTGRYDNQTPWFVWRDKTQPPTEPDEGKARLYARGHALEPTVVNMWEEANPGITTRRAGLHQSRQHPVLLASVDRLTSDGGGLEAKTTTSHSIRAWAEDYGRDVPPPHYVTQCQHYLLVTGRTHWWLAVLVIDTWELLVWRIEPDHEEQELIVACAEEFWATHVAGGIEPLPDEHTNLDEILARYQRDDGSVLALEEGTAEAHELHELWAERVALKADEKAAGDRIKEIDDQLRLLAQGHAEVKVGDRKVFTWKAQTARRFSSTRFREDHPEVWAQYATESEMRVLRVNAKAFA